MFKVNNKNTRMTFFFQCFCDQSDGLSYGELSAVSSAGTAILQKTSSGRKLNKKKKEMDEDRTLTHSRVTGTLRT